MKVPEPGCVEKKMGAFAGYVGAAFEDHFGSTHVDYSFGEELFLQGPAALFQGMGIVVYVQEALVCGLWRLANVDFGVGIWLSRCWLSSM